MSLTIGLPAEIKVGERRVALTPSAVAGAVAAGHRVLVEAGAGAGAGYGDTEYKEAGAEIRPEPEEVWSADVVIKVKEPQEAEYRYFRPDLTLFAYLHLAAEARLTRALLESGIDAYAFETLTEGSGLPLLAPMSEIAGRAAAIVAAHALAASEGGSGVLAGGAAGVAPARAVVIGLGVAGSMAARGLSGLDAHVTGVDLDLRLLHERRMDGTVHASLASERQAVHEAVATADVVIGAALVPGARAPVVVTEDAVTDMRSGSVIVDLAIDQGGCVATSQPTTHQQPTYVAHDVVHYCVTNVPGIYPRTASAALSAAVAPRLLQLAADPSDPRLRGAANVIDGQVVHPVVAEAVS